MKIKELILLLLLSVPVSGAVGVVHLDQSFAYSYDDNGNMTYDAYKKMRIYYNHLNLPDSIVVENKGKIENTYLADGTLLERREMDFFTGEVEKVNYEGLFLFKNDSLEYVFTDEGYVQDGKYHYVLADQTQSTRAIINEDGEVVQRNNYYAYGGIIPALSYNAGYNYTFGGKEKWNAFGVGVSDFHARIFNTQEDNSPFSWQLDPKAEEFYHLSPYGLFGGNPISFIDPDGMRKVYYNDDGTYEETTHNNWFHNFFRGNQIYVENTQGEYTNISQAAFDNWQSDIDRKAWFSRSIDYHFTPGSSEINPLTGQVLQGGALVNISPEFAILSMGVGTLSSSLKLTAKTAAKSLTDDAVRMGVNAAKSSANLLKAANAPSKGGLTAVGRALQKHGSRAGSIYPKATGNAASINAQGQSVLKGILNNPNATTVTRHHARFGKIMDIRVPGGQGARFSADGKTFIHFLE